MSGTLNLNPNTTCLVKMLYNVVCAILGDEGAFEIEIEGNKRVSELKNRIKTHEYPMLSASSLELYKVDIPWSDRVALMASVSQQTIMYHEDQRLQDPWDFVSTVFGPTLLENTLHILAKIPRGESFSSS